MGGKIRWRGLIRSFIVLCVPHLVYAFNPNPLTRNKFYTSISKEASQRLTLPITTKTTKRGEQQVLLRGKRWDKLGIEPDPLEYEPLWYMLKCMPNGELEAAEQARMVTSDFSKDLVEKISVPLERKLRSHGKKNVVEMKVIHSGLVFCKIRLCAKTFETLHFLPLGGGFQSGIIHQIGYKKLPLIPVALSDEELSQFTGLDEHTDELFEKYGEDYNGKGDAGLDLMDQYKGFKYDDMVKILTGNLKGEVAVVKRLKNGKIFVYMGAYGTPIEKWYTTEDIRLLTDSEAIRGLTGDGKLVIPDGFKKVKRKKKKIKKEDGRWGIKLRNSWSGGERFETAPTDQLDQHDEMQRRIRERKREQSGNKDIENVKTTDDIDQISIENDSSVSPGTDSDNKVDDDDFFEGIMSDLSDTLQKKADVAPSPSSNAGDGDDFFTSLMSDLSSSIDDSPQGREKSQRYTSGRQERKEKSREKSSNTNGRFIKDDINDSSSNSNIVPGDNSEDDFFKSLMSELSDTLEETPSKHISDAQRTSTPSNDINDDDDFFNSLLSELSSATDDNPDSSRADGESNTNQKKDRSQQNDSVLGNGKNDKRGNEVSGTTQDSPITDDDDFFSSLMSELSDSMSDETESSSAQESSNSNDTLKGLDQKHTTQQQNELVKEKVLQKDEEIASIDKSEDDDFFNSLMAELEDSVDDGPNFMEKDVPSHSTSSQAKREEYPDQSKMLNSESNESIKTGDIKSPHNTREELSKLTMPLLKDMLRKQGLKVSGRKNELIERLL